MAAYGSLLHGLFLLIVLVLAVTLNDRARPGLLLAASLLFYAWGDLGRLPLLVVVIVLAHRGGIVMTEHPSRTRLWLFIGLILAPLLYFKYHGWVAHLLGWSPGLTAPGGILSTSVLPIGISFFTFQAVAYVVDVFRRQINAERRLERVALFLAFFPNVLAGPIERAGHLMPQLERLRTGQWIAHSDLTRALFLILKGLFIKLVLADNFALFVDEVHASLPDQPGAEALLACYLYSAQIYCDFYGYTLIALGGAAVFGVELTQNFEHPYLSTNIVDFWRRWHTSLSTWLRDYVFFPLGGLRNPLNRYRNTLITMLACGLWHGAGLKFLLWGGLHGLALAAQHRFRSREPRRTRSLLPVLGSGLGLLLTFHFVTASWILFRSNDLASAQVMATKILAWAWSPSLPTHTHSTFYYRLGLAFVILECIDYRVDLATLFRRSPAALKVLWIVLWFCGLHFAPLTSVKFIYFQF